MTEAEPQRSGTERDEQPSTSGRQFITHKITKFDTLAGLAIRYNASVSDIKHCNGLLSDTAMYARDKLIIPTMQMPLGQEYTTWAGMIVTHYGTLGGVPDASGSPMARMRLLRPSLRMGLGGRGYHNNEEDVCHLLMPARLRPGSALGCAREVELVERAEGPATDAIDERLRRRRAAEGEPREEEGRQDGGHIPQPSAPQPRRPRQAASGGGPTSGAASALGALRAWASANILDTPRQPSTTRPPGGARMPSPQHRTGSRQRDKDE